MGKREKKFFCINNYYCILIVKYITYKYGIMNNMKKLLKKSAYLRQKAEIHMENFDDDMTIEFGDFAHYMGSKISPSTIFNSHFRPQFLGCKGILSSIFSYFSYKTFSNNIYAFSHWLVNFCLSFLSCRWGFI